MTLTFFVIKWMAGVTGILEILLTATTRIPCNGAALASFVHPSESQYIKIRTPHDLQYTLFPRRLERFIPYKVARMLDNLHDFLVTRHLPRYSSPLDIENLSIFELTHGLNLWFLVPYLNRDSSGGLHFHKTASQRLDPMRAVILTIREPRVRATYHVRFR